MGDLIEYILWPSLVLIGRHLEMLDIWRCYSVNKVKYGKFSNLMADNSDSSGPISSIIKLIQDENDENARKFSK